MEQPSDMARRRLLGWAGAAVSGLLAAAGAVPLLGTLLSPLLRPRVKDAGFVPVGRTADLPVGEPRKLEVRAQTTDAWQRMPEQALGAVWVTREADGQVRALSSVCPHLGCGIHQEGAGFACPCHTSKFDAQGAVVSGPSPRGMDPLEVKVEGGQVQVRYTRFRQGQKEREEV